MGKEIERKFLVNKELWDALKTDGVIYRQGYLLNNADKTIRVRIAGNEKGFITIKGKTKGISRAEYEYTIPAKDAEELLNVFCNAVVTKKRYTVNENNKVWEVDEFMYDNEGLIVAEIELEDEAEQINLPGWIDKEVTNNKRYYNSELSVNPYKNWNL